MPFSSSSVVQSVHTTLTASSPYRFTRLLSISVLLQAVCFPILFASGSSNLRVPLGTGAFKLGLNYAPGVMPQKAAAKLGYAQNLWLHGPEHYLTEVCYHLIQIDPKAKVRHSRSGL